MPQSGRASHPKPGWLGFSLQDMTEGMALALDLPQETRGAIVSSVTPSGPASHASLRPGDVLTELDGTKLRDSRAFMWSIAKMPIGKVAHLKVWHDRSKRDVTATITEWPNYMPGTSEKSVVLRHPNSRHPGHRVRRVLPPCTMSTHTADITREKPATF
jgi:S1-C subfamily serine protease